MPTRENPFYKYRNPAIGQAFDGLASIFAPQSDSKEQAILAQARANTSLAGYRDEQTRGERDKNDAMTTNPQALAELLLSGGVLKDDPFKVNPEFNPQPIDWANVLSTPNPTGPITSALLSGATAQDKMAAALQEASIRGLKLDDVLKAAGISEYQRRAFGANPDTALAAGPFVGLNPNTQTALSTGRQDAISARDAGEDLTKQQSINQTNITREGMQQGGANARNQFSVLNAPVSAGNNSDVVVSPTRGKALGLEPDADGRYVVRGRTTVGTGQDQQPGSLGGEAVAGRTKPAGGAGAAGGKTTAVPVAASKRMQSILEKSMADKGITVNPESMSGLLAEAGTAWQTSKNPDAAADAIVQRLNSGESVNGVSINTQQRILRSDKKSLTRTPGGAAPDISTVKGAPRGATIGAIVQGRGYEVKDSSGKVIGYAQ